MESHAALYGPRFETAQDSWVGLLASTMGLDGFGRCRVAVRGELDGPDPVRIVVQVFGRTGGGLPLAAAQRVVQPTELRDGVELDVLHDSGSTDGCAVVAWAERDGLELDFGALKASPEAALALTWGTLGGDRVALSLSHARLAA